MESSLQMLDHDVFSPKAMCDRSSCEKPVFQQWRVYTYATSLGLYAIFSNGVLYKVGRPRRLNRAWRAWHGPGIVVATLGPRKESLYVALGSSLWKVSSRNVRKTSPQESIAQDAVEKFVSSLKTRPGRPGLRRYVDCTRENQHLDEAGESDEEKLHANRKYMPQQVEHAQHKAEIIKSNLSIVNVDLAV
eukprot:5751040-Amphidinium_carterae.3